jgi:hypothetical protein
MKNSEMIYIIVLIATIFTGLMFDWVLLKRIVELKEIVFEKCYIIVMQETSYGQLLMYNNNLTKQNNKLTGKTGGGRNAKKVGR